MTDNHCFECRLAIANIGVMLRCRDATLFERVYQRYHQFDAPPQTPMYLVLDMGLDANVQPDQPDPNTPIFNHQTGSFITTYSRGHIDIAAGYANLRLSSVYPDNSIEECLRVIYALLAFQQDGLLFHGAGVAQHGQAIVFFGTSGSGKTTVSRLSRTLPDTTVLNDDLVLLLRGDSGWLVYSTPFWNPTQVPPAPPQCAPLAMMLRLVQARQVAVEPVSQGTALAELLAGVPVMTASNLHSDHLLGMLFALLRSVPVSRLHFLPDASFWPVVRRLLVQQQAEHA